MCISSSYSCVFVPEVRFILNRVCMALYCTPLMAWGSWALTPMMIGIIWSGCHSLVRSCDFVELFERVDDPQPFLQQHAPSAVAGQLGLCSRWCADVMDCPFFSWRPGLCVQVGASGFESVLTTVYIVCDGPAQKPTLAVDLWVYWLPLRMVHGKTKEQKNKTKHKQNKTTSATNKQSRHNKNT